jgi:hypothetical protein
MCVKTKSKREWMSNDMKEKKKYKMIELSKKIEIFIKKIEKKTNNCFSAS